MKTPRPHADLIKAWADGAEIESKYGDGRWTDCGSPMWVDGGEYRIKAEPKPDSVEFYRAEARCHTGVRRSEHWERDNLKLTFDGETGKLKSAEVIA